MGAVMPNFDAIQMTGLDPRTGLPVKTGLNKCMLKEDVRKGMRVMDEQNAIGRYHWVNLPKGLNGNLIERILYYRGQGAFFYMSTSEKFFFLPYALVGNLDVYGRYTSITPVPFAGGSTDNKKDKPWISGLKFECIYDELSVEEWALNDYENTACVLLSDYSKQLSQVNIPRYQLQEPIIDVMSDCIPFMRTALLNSTGVQGMRVGSEDEQSNVKAASAALNRSALIGDKWVPVVGQVEFQELTSGTQGRIEEFMMSLQSLDNLRLSQLGLDQGGLFQKKSHMLEAEQEMNAGNVGLILQDGLSQRQKFCNIVNSIWGLGIWCENSETVTSIDRDGNGEAKDEATDEMTQDDVVEQGVASDDEFVEL